MGKNYLNKKIEVCDKCLKVSCWHGIFMCDESDIAVTKIMTVRELRKLNKEDYSWYNSKSLKEQYGEVAPFGYV